MSVEMALAYASAGELARRIARGELSAVEVVEAHIARIEQVNARLNAVVVKRYDEARAEAREADARRARGEPLGPLHGVPVTVEEIFDLVGTPTTYGLTTRAAPRAERDDPYVARLRAAGAIILGKTNTSQLLLYAESDNPVYGRTNNPWHPARTSGGGSGGEAALLAAGGAALGLGAEIGGGVRLPSAFCGVAGLLPTAGRTPVSAPFAVFAGQQALRLQAAPLARTVDDLALALAVAQDGADPTIPPLGDPARVEVARLRVGYFADDGALAPAPAVRRATLEAAGYLAGRGAQVVEWRPPEVAAALDLFYGFLSADGGRDAWAALRGGQRDPRSSRLLTLAGLPRPALAALRAALALGGQRNAVRVLHNVGDRSALHYWRLVEAQEAYRRRFAQALDADEGGPFDLLICPVAAVPAFSHGASADLLTAGGYAPLFNVVGYPAGALPVTRVRPGEETPRRRTRDAMERAARAAERESAGLPVGVQVVARPWREHVALAAMRAIEEDARRQPDYPAAPGDRGDASRA